MPARAVLSHVALGLLDERLLPQRIRELLPRRPNHVIAEIDLRKSRKRNRQATKVAKEPESQVHKDTAAKRQTPI